MTQKVKETTHMELAEVLAGNQVETENVLQALEMIRESIAFDGGAVYQAERSGRFYLAEQQAAGQCAAAPGALLRAFWTTQASTSTSMILTRTIFCM